MGDNLRDYENDVFYEVWRRGGNPDRIDDDRVSDAYYDGVYADDCAAREMRRIYPPQPEIEYPEEPEL